MNPIDDILDALEAVSAAAHHDLLAHHTELQERNDTHLTATVFAAWLLVIQIEGIFTILATYRDACAEPPSYDAIQDLDHIPF